MAGSESGQDEPNHALWLATRAGKIDPSCPLGTTRCTPQAKFPQKPYNKSFIDQVCSVKMAGYWPSSFFCEFMDLDFVSAINMQKKNLAIIQPSWPHTWSTTHTNSIKVGTHEGTSLYDWFLQQVARRSPTMHVNSPFLVQNLIAGTNFGLCD